MNIALISDIHDHHDFLQRAVDDIAARDIRHIIGLGDYCTPRTIARLVAVGIPISIVWGNNDTDRATAGAIMAQHPHVTFSDREYGVFTIDGATYFCTHFPLIAEHAAVTSDYAAVFHGHTHRTRDENIGHTPIVNPGSIMPHADTGSTYAVFDTRRRRTKIIVLAKK